MRTAQFHKRNREKTMEEKLKFYIDGKWVDPVKAKTLEVINPANEEPFAKISMGSKADVDKAVAAARKAFDTFSQTSREERVALLEKITAVYQKRYADIVKAISMEMGAPLALSQNAQAAIGMGHLAQGIKILKEYEFEEVKGSYAIRREPIGVVGMITPWNWPINQIAC
jgi:aldehyde dehydrogenase (NAD+)